MKILSLLPVTALIAIGFVTLQNYQKREKAKLPEPEQSEPAQVISVDSGDRLTVKVGSSTHPIKLCGIDPPAKSPLKEKSRKNLQRLVDSAKGSVMVWKVEGELAEVFVSAPTAAQPEQEKFLNAEQLLAGLASPNKQPCYN